MPDLNIGLQFGDRLPTPVRQEFEQLITALQEWSQKVQASILNGAPIAVTKYGPHTPVTYNSTAGVYTDVDPKNLNIRFTAPQSGRVRVRLSAYVSYNSPGNFYIWLLRSGGTNVQKTGGAVSGGVVESVVQQTFLIEGLRPGQEYFWKWAHITGAGVASMKVSDGTSYPQAVMEVWGLP